MSKITAFSPTNLDEIRQAMKKALEAVEQEFGITCKIDKMNYTSEAFKCGLNFMVADDMLEGVDPKFVQECLKYRETKDLFKKEFDVNGDKHTIVGIKPRTTGQTLVVRRSSDKRLRVVQKSDVVKFFK